MYSPTFSRLFVYLSVFLLLSPSVTAKPTPFAKDSLVKRAGKPQPKSVDTSASGDSAHSKNAVVDLSHSKHRASNAARSNNDVPAANLIAARPKKAAVNAGPLKTTAANAPRKVGDAALPKVDIIRASDPKHVVTNAPRPQNAVAAKVATLKNAVASDPRPQNAATKALVSSRKVANDTPKNVVVNAAPPKNVHVAARQNVKVSATADAPKANIPNTQGGSTTSTNAAAGSNQGNGIVAAGSSSLGLGLTVNGNGAGTASPASLAENLLTTGVVKVLSGSILSDIPLPAGAISGSNPVAGGANSAAPPTTALQIPNGAIGNANAAALVSGSNSNGGASNNAAGNDLDIGFLSSLPGISSADIEQIRNILKPGGGTGTTITNSDLQALISRLLLLPPSTNLSNLILRLELLSGSLTAATQTAGNSGGGASDANLNVGFLSSLPGISSADIQQILNILKPGGGTGTTITNSDLQALISRLLLLPSSTSLSTLISSLELLSGSLTPAQQTAGNAAGLTVDFGGQEMTGSGIKLSPDQSATTGGPIGPLQVTVTGTQNVAGNPPAGTISSTSTLQGQAAQAGSGGGAESLNVMVNK